MNNCVATEVEPGNLVKIVKITPHQSDSKTDFFTKLLNEVNETVNKEKDTYTGLELFNLDQKSIPTLVEGIIPKQGIFSIVGASDTGKSMILRQLGICVASNTPFIGFGVNPIHQKVIFIATEDDDLSTSWLLQKHHNPNL